MFKKGEICVIAESGVDYFNENSICRGGLKVELGEKLVCREDSSVPFCTPLRAITEGCGECSDYEGKDFNTWALSSEDIESTGEFMELD